MKSWEFQERNTRSNIENLGTDQEFMKPSKMRTCSVTTTTRRMSLSQTKYGNLGIGRQPAEAFDGTNHIIEFRKLFIKALKSGVQRVKGPPSTIVVPKYISQFIFV